MRANEFQLLGIHQEEIPRFLEQSSDSTALARPQPQLEDQGADVVVVLGGIGRADWQALGQNRRERGTDKRLSVGRRKYEPEARGG